MIRVPRIWQRFLLPYKAQTAPPATRPADALSEVRQVALSPASPLHDITSRHLAYFIFVYVRCPPSGLLYLQESNLTNCRTYSLEGSRWWYLSLHPIFLSPPPTGKHGNPFPAKRPGPRSRSRLVRRCRSYPIVLDSMYAGCIYDSFAPGRYIPGYVRALPRYGCD